jgi:CBS domain-containing protein
MICPSCHAENIEGVDECANCGQPLYGLDLPGAKGGTAPEFVNDPLGTLPKHEAPRVGVSDPVGLAVRHMQQRDTYCVLVMDGERLAGIITGWDILQKVAGPREDLNAVTCGQVMTPEPATLLEEDTIALALNRMASGDFHHVPILREKQPPSVIDHNDVFRHISPHLV